MNILQKAGGIVLQRKTGNVCVVMNEFGRFVIPKGSIEQHETPEIVAKREVYEETGLKALTLLRKAGVLKRSGHASVLSKHADVLKEIHFFLYETSEDSLRPQTSDSVSARWVDVHALAKTLSWVEEYEFVKKKCPELFAR